MNIVEISEVARNILLSFGAGFASYAAYYGAKSWKRQTTFSRKFEVTLELLRAASWLERAFSLARTPLDGLSKEEVDQHGLKEAKRSRAFQIWGEFFPSIRRFEDALLDARIFRTDPLLEECGSEIREAVKEFRAAIHFEAMGIDTSDSDLQKQLILGRYDTGDENPTTQKMHNAVERLINLLGKELRA